MPTSDLSERGQKIIQRSSDRIEVAETHLLERENLIEKWNREETKGFFFPAPEWDKTTRVAKHFTKRTFVIAGLGFICGGIPLLLMLPSLVLRANRRERLGMEILREEMSMRSVLPVPLDEEDYNTVVENSSKFRSLALEGVIFENTYIKKGVQF